MHARLTIAGATWPIDIDQLTLGFDMAAPWLWLPKPCAAALTLTRGALQAADAAFRAGQGDLPATLTWHEANGEAVWPGRLDLSTFVTGAGYGTAQWQPNAISGLSLKRRVELFAAGTELAWLGPLQPSDATLVSGILRLETALQRALSAATAGGATLYAPALSAAGPYGGVALATGGLLRCHPAARWAPTCIELLDGVCRLLGLAAVATPGRLSLVPLARLVAAEPTLTLYLEATPRRQPTLHFGQLAYGPAEVLPWHPADAHSASFAVCSSNEGMMDLRHPFQTSPSAIRAAGTDGYDSERPYLSRPADAQLFALDLVPLQPQLGSNVSWQTAAGVEAAMGMAHPSLLWNLGLSPAAQLRRTSALWGHLGIAQPVGQSAVGGAAPPHRTARSYDLADGLPPFADAANGLLAAAPVVPTSVRFTGQALYAHLPWTSDLCMRLLDDPPARVRLRWGAASYAEGLVSALRFAPHTGRANLTLLAFT